MDADGLPIVGPGIDFTKVGAIHQKRTVAFLNHFITHTARFLNRFSCVCEEKLEDLLIRIQRLEASVNILESKLSSIPGLENVTVASASSTSTTPTAASNETASPEANTQAAPSPPEQEAAPEPEKQDEKPVMTVAQDPRYAKFFKMINVGVPMMALRAKMEAEGLNPDLLETPDAPAPPGGTTAEDSDLSDQDSDSSGFSD